MTHPGFERAFDILRMSEVAHVEAARSVCTFLPSNPAAGFIVETAAYPLSLFSRQNADVLNNVAEVLETARLERCITDWPFANFWRNPNEPQHSKLIHFFLTSASSEHAREQLLGGLLEQLGVRKLLLTGCLVRAEVPIQYDGYYGFIDILIEREAADDRYAVIIENKVNGARDTEAQLYKYVGFLKKERGFREVWVIYLPLRPGRYPSLDSLRDIDRKYFVVKSFEEDILPWLSNACAQEHHDEMRDSLQHYRNLIRYLVNKNKEMSMDSEIIRQLEAAGKNVPRFADVIALKESVTKLADSFQKWVRANVLLQIISILRNNNHADARLYGADREDGPMQEVKDSDPNLYGDQWLGVGIPVAPSAAQSKTIAMIGLTVTEPDSIGVRVGDRGIEQERDKEFADLVSKHFKNKPLPYYPENSWYHYSDKYSRINMDAWAESASDLAKLLAEYWATLNDCVSVAASGKRMQRERMERERK